MANQLPEFIIEHETVLIESIPFQSLLVSQVKCLQEKTDTSRFQNSFAANNEIEQNSDF